MPISVHNGAYLALVSELAPFKSITTTYTSNIHSKPFHFTDYSSDYVAWKKFSSHEKTENFLFPPNPFLHGHLRSCSPLFENCKEIPSRTRRLSIRNGPDFFQLSPPPLCLSSVQFSSWLLLLLLLMYTAKDASMWCNNSTTTWKKKPCKTRRKNLLPVCSFSWQSSRKIGFIYIHPAAGTGVGAVAGGKFGEDGYERKPGSKTWSMNSERKICFCNNFISSLRNPTGDWLAQNYKTGNNNCSSQGKMWFNDGKEQTNETKAGGSQMRRRVQVRKWTEPESVSAHWRSWIFIVFFCPWRTHVEMHDECKDNNFAYLKKKNTIVRFRKFRPIS